MSNVKTPRIYADFHNADAQGRLRLNCTGTAKDLARQRVALRAGLRLTLYADDADADGTPDDLEVDGVVEFSEAEQCWVARIDWNDVRHVSDVRPASSGAVQTPVPVARG